MMVGGGVGAARPGSGEAFGWSEGSYGNLRIQRKWADVGRLMRRGERRKRRGRQRETAR